MSVISGIVGALSEKDSADNATHAQRQNVKDTNRANLALAIMQRGGTLTAAEARSLGLPEDAIGKTSAILPYYLSDYESTLGKNAAEAALSMQSGGFDSPEVERAYYQSLINKYGDSFTNADRVAASALDGTMTSDMLNEAQPVFEARTNLAQSKKSAGLEALQQTLNEIDMVQARKGYSGDSFGNRLLKFNARQGIARQGAEDIGGATLENAISKAALQQQGRNTALSNVTLPDTLARSAVNRANLANTTQSSRYSSSLAPLQMFGIGVGNASNQMAPSSAFANNGSSMGAIANGMAGVGNAALNIWANKKNNDALLKYGTGTSYGGGGGSTGLSSWESGGYNDYGQFAGSD